MKKAVFGRKNTSKLTERREAIGYIFIIPWIIGSSVFFIYPFLQSIWFAFCNLSFSENGLVTDFIGFENFKIVFFESPTVFQKFASSIGQTLSELVLVITVSFFLSIILNQEFKGKVVARAIFSLPLIVSSGVLLSIFKGNLFSQSQDALQQSTVFEAAGIQSILENTGLGTGFVEMIVKNVNMIVDMLWKSGVQLIVFLAGLQSIPVSFYEVCDIEGSTSWQKFWRVTFPVMMPFVFLNIIYTIIDSFTYYSNPIMKQILTYFNNLQYSLSNALAFAYFIVIIVITGIIAKLLSGHIVYTEK